MSAEAANQAMRVMRRINMLPGNDRRGCAPRGERRCRRAATLIAVAAGLLIGCDSPPKTNSTQLGVGASSMSGDTVFTSPGTAINRPAPMRSARVLVEINPCGAVPYDNMTLPQVSPDGRFVATQAGLSPTWATILAEHAADAPAETRIEIYEVNPGDSALNFRTMVDASVVLGRSCDTTGFLIEAPQDDGSRWIGRVRWESGSIEWLVADEYVNAFASLGPDGRLAWCRRPIDGPEDRFELVVRHGKDEWVLTTPGESWFMPVWSGRDDGLFALSLSGDRLSAVFGHARSRQAFMQSRRRLDLATGANVYSAYQAVVGQSHAVLDSRRPVTDELVIHHPSLLRMAIWRPVAASRGRSLTLLDRRSFGAVTDGEHAALVATEDALLHQSLRDSRVKSEVMAGVQLPRRISHETWPFMLLSPADGRIGVTLMRPTSNSPRAQR